MCNTKEKNEGSGGGYGGVPVSEKLLPVVGTVEVHTDITEVVAIVEGTLPQSI